MAQMFPLISGFSSCPVRCSTPSASSTTSVPTSEDDVVVVAETDTETTDDNNNSTFERTRFAIPWGKVPTRVMKKLKKGKRPTPSERLETLRIISAELKEAFSPDPVPRKEMKMVAQNIVSCYKDSFEDNKIDGGRLGSGWQSVFTQIENRIYNERSKLNRVQKKRKLPSAAVVAADGGNHDEAVETRPTIPEGETEESLLEMQNSLKREYLKPKSERDNDLVVKFMETTYYIQHEMISKGGTVLAIKDDWPFIFEVQHLQNYFNSFMDMKFSDCLDESLLGRNKGKRIFAYLDSYKSDNPWISRLRQAQVESPSNLTLGLGVLLLLPERFSENVNTLFMFYGVSTRSLLLGTRQRQI